MTRTTKRRISAFFMLTSLLVSLLLAFFPPSVKNANADSNVASWIMCKTEDGKVLYNAATTDLVPYSVRSKSSIGKTQTMDGFLNSILNVSGYKFDEVNTAILGRPIHNRGESEEEEGAEGSSENDSNGEEGTENPNASAPKVTPFDRFGVAGLNFSSYAGEWKYYETDGCSDGNEASPVEFGKFYENRKEPQQTFNEISQSKDPRVQQYNKGIFSAWSASLSDMITNGLFSITKVIVTMTIALIGLAFVDLTELIGFGDAAIGGMSGMFTNLYNGFFMPMVMFAILVMTCYIMYYGLIKRQVRKALVNGLATTVIAMLFAAIIAVNPDFWLPLPNNIATMGQAVVISALGQSTDSTNGLCGTNVAGLKTDNVKTNSAVAKQKEQMEAIGENMKSTIGCRMWEEFLLKPWTRGQFGTEYKELNAGGTKDGKVRNINGEWVGTADVPLGGDVVANNWALFHLSTQTEVHAQLSSELSATDPSQNMIRLVDGMSADWWRVVDAFSNYDDKEEKIMPPGGKTEVPTTVQVNAQPLPEWQSWIGNKPQERYSTAILSIFFGAVGSLGPLVFAALTAVYSAGITLFMATAPIFLLLACFPGKGQGMFKGWAEGLVGLMIKKIVASGLLLISFAITVNAMDMVDEVGWIKSFILLLIMTFVLIRSRHKIFEVFSRVNFGGLFRPDQAFKAYSEKQKRRAKTVTDVGLAGAAGAVEAKKAGMSAIDGARIGAGFQAQQTMRRSQAGRSFNTQYNKVGGTDGGNCTVCGHVVNEDGFAYYDEDYNLICKNCARDYGIETTLTKVEVNKPNQANSSIVSKNRLKKISKQQVITREYGLFEKPVNATNKDLPKNAEEYKLSHPKSYLSYKQSLNQADIWRDEDNNIYWDNQAVENMINKNLVGLEQDIVQFDKEWNEKGPQMRPPSVPEPIEKYLPATAMNEAWQQGRYDVVREAYREGWSQWYGDNSIAVSNITGEEFEETRDRIANTDHGEIAEFIAVKSQTVEGYENVPVFKVMQEMNGEIEPITNETLNGGSAPEVEETETVNVRKTNKASQFFAQMASEEGLISEDEANHIREEGMNSIPPKQEKVINENKSIIDNESVLDETQTTTNTKQNNNTPKFKGMPDNKFSDEIKDNTKNESKQKPIKENSDQIEEFIKPERNYDLGDRKLTKQEKRLVDQIKKEDQKADELAEKKFNEEQAYKVMGKKSPTQKRNDKFVKEIKKEQKAQAKEIKKSVERADKRKEKLKQAPKPLKFGETRVTREKGKMGALDKIKKNTSDFNKKTNENTAPPKRNNPINPKRNSDKDPSDE